MINREVEIQPRNLEGGQDRRPRTGNATPATSASQPLTVIIEVKGCWNPEIKTGISQQLLPYLQPRPGWAGIFLVGYFHHPGREHETYTGPRTAAAAPEGGIAPPRKHTPEEILRDLQQQIAAAPGQHHARPRPPTAPHPATRI